MLLKFVFKQRFVFYLSKQAYLALLFFFNPVLLISLPICVNADELRFAFTANSLDNTISTYAANADTGRLTHRYYLPTFKNPSSLRVSKDGSYLYVASQTIDEIRVFKINKSSGKLTWLEQATVPSHTRSTISLAFSHRHKVLFTPGRFTANLVPFGIDSNSGKLTSLMGKGVEIGYPQVRFANIHPSENYVYATSQEAGLMSVFRYKPDTKKLVSIQEPIKTGSSPQEIIVHPNGKYVYVVNYVSGDLSSYAVNPDDGRLSIFNDSPEPLELFPVSGVVDTSGRFLYVANRGTSRLSAFYIDKNNGKLTAFKQSPVTLDAMVIKLTTDRKGDYLYALSNIFDTISTYKIDKNSGEFVKNFRIKSRRGVKDIDFLYADRVAKIESNTALILNQDKSALSLVQLKGQNKNLSVKDTISINGTPTGFVYSSEGHLIFVADRINNTITAIKLEHRNWKLSQVPGPVLTLPASPIDMQVDMNGHYLYIITSNPNVYAVYAIDPVSGTLQGIEGTNLPADAKLGNLVIGPSGQNSIITVTSSNEVNFADFRLSDYAILEKFRGGSNQKVGSAPVHSVVDLSSRFLYVANQDSNDISAMSMPRQQDGLQPVTASPYASGEKPIFLAIHPTLPVLYCINQLGKSISRFNINEDSGELKEILPRFKSGIAADKLAIQASGARAYIVDKTGRTIYEVAIDLSDGAMSQLFPIPSLQGSTDILLLK